MKRPKVSIKRNTALGLTLILAIPILLSVVSAPKASADSFTGQGLQVSPVLVELNGDPGKTYTINITVQNVTTADLVYLPFVNDFQAKDETGTPQVLLTKTLPASESLVDWVQPIKSLRINSKQSTVIPVKVTIPSNTDPGGHYGVIRFSGIPPNLQNTGVSLAASVGTLLLVRVSGNANESLLVKDFYEAQNGKQSGFFETGPITFVERILDNGNVFLKPQGSIVVKDMFGHITGTLAVNSDGGNILPNSIRRFSQQLNKAWMIGRYTASMDLTYGTHGQVIQSSTNFWVIPWKLIIIALIGLAVLFHILKLLIRRYNANVIRKAKLGKEHYRKKKREK